MIDPFLQIHQLGAPAELWRRAAALNGAGKRRPANAHIHLPPNFSAFRSNAQPVKLAAAQGVHVLGASNYYDFSVYRDFAALARANNIFPLFGLETIALDAALLAAGVKVNDPGNPGKIYLCGKGIARFTELSPRAAMLLNTIRANDSRRMERMIEKLDALFAQRGMPTGITVRRAIERIAVRDQCARDAVYLQERHVAQIFQEWLFEQFYAEERRAALEKICGAPAGCPPDDAVAVQGEIRSQLMKAGKPAFVAEEFISCDEALEFVFELGGVPCYPVLADGATPVCAYEAAPAELIRGLRAKNIFMAELIPIRNKPEVLRAYVTALRGAGFAVTAGTEHNTLELLPLEPRCAGGAAIDADVQDIFWEGVCVCVAHQYLAFNGAAGFVDAQGRPNSAYRNAEERIAAFARFGAAVLEKYFAVKN